MGNQSLATNLPFLVLFICQMLFGSCGKAFSNISCIESERRALLNFKKGLIDKSNRLSSWIGENCCKWEGISCNIRTGRIEKLDLRNPIVFQKRYSFDTNYRSYHDSRRLGGEISSSLVHLEYLQHLDLSMNNFSATQIPTFFGTFKYIRYLNLSKAYFNGQIPSHLGNLSRLQYLDLGDFYQIPPYGLKATSLWWITGLSSLKSLDLSAANLSEAYDWLQAINMLPSLLSLDVRDCELKTPPTLSHVNVTSLVSLDLSGNQLDSPFPLWLFNISSLGNLKLSYNEIQGTLPNEIDKLKHLTVLDLSGNEFNTSIPNSVCTLTSLTHMDLGYNFFRGKLPLCLQNLTSLTILDLESNRFQGRIPFEIGHLGKLTELDLSYNQLDGAICPSLGQLKKLQLLDISHNSFAGELTELHFANLTELRKLDISWTILRLNVSSQWSPPFQLLQIFMDSIQVGPQFPPWLETQKRVVKLGLRNASISDAIPDWFEIVYSHINFLDLSINQIIGKPPEIGVPYSYDFRLPEFQSSYGSNFRKLDLGFNKFQGSLNTIPRYVDSFIISSNSMTGQIPPIDGNWTTLEFLILNDNGFTGNIPSTICNIMSLIILDLSNNHLFGKIPFCIGNLQYLDLLNLANNSLFGQIPGTLGNLTGLELLQLKENKFHGELPLSLQNLTNLKAFDLGDNQFSGTLPRWFGKELPHLAWLRLQSNNFYGDIPLELCQLSSLQVLNLAQNNFTGPIPRCFGNFSAMTRSTQRYKGYFVNPIYYTKRPRFSNPMKGNELGYSVYFMSINSIALSENKIAGEIPKELMDLVELQGLDLSKNHLKGRIPENIGSMKKLESLDLSINEFSGPIPPSLATIDTLGYLNLSFNSLSGQIPQGNHFQTLDDKSIYEGNRELCGKPLPDNCPIDKPSKEGGTVDLHHGKSFDISWVYAGIGPGFAVGFIGMVFLLRFKKSWRYAYFTFVENLCSSVWILIVVKFSVLCKKFKRVTA